MYKLFERVSKSIEHPRGSKPITKVDNPFLTSPCLLCIPGVSTIDKSVFGLSKEGMKMARVRVRGQRNAGFDLSDFPVKFLSIKLDRTDEERKYSNDERVAILVDDYLVDLISDNGKKINCEDAMRRMRNLNIMSYCDGTLMAQRIENTLLDRMQELGYTDEECAKIQSQMGIIAIATNRLNGTQKSTCISFKDINDAEVNDNVSQEEREQIDDTKLKEVVFDYSDNEKAFLFEGDGEHSLKGYQHNGRTAPVCISSFVSRLLENAIKNSKLSEGVIPINADTLLENVPIIMKKAELGMSLEELIAEQDSLISYDGTRRITEIETRLLDQLEESYDAIVNKDAVIKQSEQTIKSQKEKLERTDRAIKGNCTDATYWKIYLEREGQIGLESGMTKEEVLSSPSDREIIESRQLTKKDIGQASKQASITSTEIENAGELLNSLNKDKEIGEIRDGED